MDKLKIKVVCILVFFFLLPVYQKREMSDFYSVITEGYSEVELHVKIKDTLIY